MPTIKSHVGDRAADIVVASGLAAYLADFEHFAIGFSALMAGFYYLARMYFLWKNGDDE